jgi:tetratricopeptide (TPR) repeat protein
MKEPVMKGIKLFVFLIAIVSCQLSIVNSFAQDYERQYKNAKQLYDEKNYNLAMEAFKGLIVYDQENPYFQYASFFYALSAHYQGYPVIAKDMLVQIKKLYPQWEQIDEVNFWLAKIYFDQRDYFQALLVLKSIKSSSFRSDSEAMQRKYLAQIEDVETLKMVFEENPSNSIAGYFLAKSISRQPLYQQDVLLFESVVNQFGFNRTDFISATKPLSVKKDRYRVALLFPFLVNSLYPTPTVKQNQFILDLYQGMRLAADTLSQQGVQIELLAYDIERSIDVLKKLLETDELKSADLIVGPLIGTEETKIVQDFSLTNQIAMINPVTNNSGYLGQNPFALLYQPSHETLGRRAAEVVATDVHNKNCIVFFGDSPKDSVMAFNFITRAKELNVNIVLAEEVRKETSPRIQTVLATPTEFDDYKNPIEFKIKRDSIGSVYVATEEVAIYSKVISSVQTRKDSTRIYGLESWASPDNSSTNYDTFERLGVTLASPNFASISNQAFIDFRKKYINRHGQLPSTYARIGYEFIEFIGKVLSENGTYFQEALSQKGFIPGSLGEGYNFQNARDNQYVPFLRLKEGIMTPINKSQQR